MHTHDEWNWLEEVQTDAERAADEIVPSAGFDRRQFVFTSVVTAAAGVFGLGAKALAQGTGAPAAAQAPSPAPQVALGNGEPVSWTFQPYPGGTGVLMETLIRERGPAAFTRTPHVVEKWSGPVPTAADEIAYLPAHRLSALLKERRITSMALTKIYLDRMKRLDPTLLCAVTIMEPQALAEAAEADKEIAAGRYRGPLHGIPYGVKDLFSTKGVRTTWGSKDYEHRVIDEDAEIVVRLRQAGAILMAKLATGLFALGDQWYRGRTNNPWDLRRGSSGSSAGPASATAAGCVAFGIGTETSGSIVSPSRECGLSALRPTFGRVSRHGGMVLAWSQDRVGPICRTLEDCAMVFNVLHGADAKDPSTVTMPFHFDRAIKMSSLRIGMDAAAPKEFVDGLRELGANPTPLAARPGMVAGGFNVESAAAFDVYVQAKAKEFGIDLATVPEPPAGGGGRGGGGGGGGADATGDRGNPTGMAALTRWTGGRSQRAFEFVQAQRRRYILISEMATMLKDLDMYVPAAQGDVGLHAQTGHPCVVVQYKFEPQTGGAGGGRGRAAGAAAAETPAPAPIIYNAQPICAVLAGALYNDDKILSVAHQYQIRHEWHMKHPAI